MSRNWHNVHDRGELQNAPGYIANYSLSYTCEINGAEGSRRHAWFPGVTACLADEALSVCLEELANYDGIQNVCIVQQPDAISETVRRGYYYARKWPTTGECRCRVSYQRRCVFTQRVTSVSFFFLRIAFRIRAL